MSAPEKTYYPPPGISVHRMETFSDVVFAVTIIILVLDIRVPVNDMIKSEAHLFSVFTTLLPKFITCFMSFLTLGVFWIGQSAQTGLLARTDRNLNWLTLLFLLFVSIVPFSTAFLSEFTRFKFAVFLYWLNILLLGAATYVHWHYAYSRTYLKPEGEELLALSKSIRRRILTHQALYAAAALLCLINTYLSLAAFILIHLYNATPVLFKRSTWKRK